MFSHLDGSLQFKAFPHMQFYFSPLQFWGVGPVDLIFSPSYRQETEHWGGEGTYPNSHSFKQQSKVKNYSAVCDKVDFAA